jgi:hypothetical protein
MENNGCPSDKEIANFIRMIHLDRDKIHVRQLLSGNEVMQIFIHLLMCPTCEQSAVLKHMAIEIAFPKKAT